MAVWTPNVLEPGQAPGIKKKKKSLDQYCGMKIDITILNRILLNQIRKISEIGKKSPTTSFVGSSPFHGQL